MIVKNAEQYRINYHYYKQSLSIFTTCNPAIIQGFQKANDNNCNSLQKDLTEMFKQSFKL